MFSNNYLYLIKTKWNLKKTKKLNIFQHVLCSRQCGIISQKRRRSISKLKKKKKNYCLVGEISNGGKLPGSAKWTLKSAVSLGFCRELKLINLHHIQKNPLGFSYLRLLLGTLSNTHHDTANPPWLNALLILWQSLVLLSGILSAVPGQRETVFLRQKLHPELSVRACASDSHGHALGNTLCWLNPFLNHVSKVFLYEDLKGTWGQLEVQKVWL